MNITVHLLATFREGRFRQKNLELVDSTSLETVVAELGIGIQELGFCLVNGIHAPLTQQLNEGDDVFLCPLIAGG